jgi:hypothetical protein
LLFFASLALHAVSAAKAYSEEQLSQGQEAANV